MRDICRRLLGSRLMQAALWIFGFLAFSVGVLKLDSVLTSRFGVGTILPFVWMALVGAGICVYLAWRASSQRAKLACAYLSALPLCLAIGEAYGFYAITKTQNTQAGTTCYTHTEGTYSSDYFTPSLITGYKGKPNTTATAHKRTASGESIYQVAYHTDEFGWRITPSSPSQAESAQMCVLFFGDSFTIGEGVEDNQTLPHYVGEILNASAQAGAKGVRIYNFGFHGYGPHQALALLQSGEVESSIHACKAAVSVYESLPGHIARANGFSEWEQGSHAPRFSIARPADTESSAPRAIWSNRTESSLTRISATLTIKLLSRVSRSYLFKLLQPRYTYDESYNELYFAILSTLQDELAARLDSALLLLLWDESDKSMDNERAESRAIIKWLESKPESSRLPYILTSDLLANYKTQREKYGLHPCDLHPNALANKQIARKLAQKLAKYLAQKEQNDQKERR